MTRLITTRHHGDGFQVRITSAGGWPIAEYDQTDDEVAEWVREGAELLGWDVDEGDG